MKWQRTVLALSIGLMGSISWAAPTQEVFDKVIANRTPWFNTLTQQVLETGPVAYSEVEDRDRKSALPYQQIKGERLALASADAAQTTAYKFATFQAAALGGRGADSQMAFGAGAYGDLYTLYLNGTYALDEKSKNRLRSVDFILKDRILRGRPYQVLDANGNFRPNHAAITGSSFPSGHTWEGFKFASLMAMIYPERGDEIYARALQYGESRVILGAHFPLDTMASRVGQYFYTAQYLKDEDIVREVVRLAREARSEAQISCDMALLQHCLTREGSPVRDAYAAQGDAVGYYGQTSNTRLGVDVADIPYDANYLLRLRFPYMTDEQRLAVLAGSALPKESLAAEIGKNNWGLLNLPTAFRGPSRLYGNFVLDQDANADLDIAGFTQWDEWKNDIGGAGRLIKRGAGTLVLSGDNSFGGLDVQAGAVALTGQSRLQEESYVSHALVSVDGSLESGLTLNEGAVLNGNGYVGSLTAGAGSIVAPGHSIGTLRAGDVRFLPGSTYQVEVDDQGRTDAIDAAGRIDIQGGTVSFRYENTSDILSETQLESLLDKNFSILRAGQGVNGQFDTVQPDYLFLGTELAYGQAGVGLRFVRNGTAFVDFAQDANSRAVAGAVDALGRGNSIYESLLLQRRADLSRVAFRQLAGQAYSDLATSALQDSRHVRTAVLERMQQPRQTASTGVWGEYLRATGRQSSSQGIDGFHSRTDGFLLGADHRVGEHAVVGLSAGLGNSKLSRLADADAKSDNKHLSVYGAWTNERFALRAGAAQTWHSNTVKRTVSYAGSPDRNSSEFNATTRQMFVEAGLPLARSWGALEPYAHFSHARYKHGGAQEQGNAAALTLDAQSQSQTLGGLGLRVTWNKELSTGRMLELGAALAWQHRFSTDEITSSQSLSGQSFQVRSAQQARNAAALNVAASLPLTKNSELRLGYTGLLSSQEKNHGADLRLQVRF